MTRHNTGQTLVSPTFFFFVSLIFCSCSCKPVIRSFKVTTHDTTQVRRMTADDTLKVNWDINGKPTLLVHESVLPDSGGKILEMKLVVEKGGKEVNRVVQVEVLPANATTLITFNTELRGDTLVAEDDKNPGIWGDRFEILSVSNASGRPLTVTHDNRTAPLDKSGAPSAAFAGTHVEGRWSFKSLLTPAEKADHSLLPERLQINSVITYKRRQ
ncbi:MAG: hypothetical protein M3040_07805 [Bacteroidota bacterium]|nr:hypothetical protein [Bacteroidota bacterium]